MEIGRPEPGFYRIRLVKDGPWVPVRYVVIVRGRPDRPKRIACIVGLDDWSYDPLQLWNRCHKIPEREYRYLVAITKHAKRHEPWAPEANPDKPIDLNTLPPIF